MGLWCRIFKQLEKTQAILARKSSEFNYVNDEMLDKAERGQSTYNNWQLEKFTNVDIKDELDDTIEDDMKIRQT